MPIDPRTQAGDDPADDLVAEAEEARAEEVQGGVAKIWFGAALLAWGLWLGRRK